jgi:hypothetical protein
MIRSTPRAGWGEFCLIVKVFEPAMFGAKRDLALGRVTRAENARHDTRSFHQLPDQFVQKSFGGLFVAAVIDRISRSTPF